MRDPARLVGAVTARPGSMMLVWVRPPGGASHVYWLVGDDRSGAVVPRWVDPQRPGQFHQEVRVGGLGADWWGVRLGLPDTRVAVFDPQGQPVDPAGLDGTRTDVGAGGVGLDPALAFRPGMYGRGAVARRDAEPALVRAVAALPPWQGAADCVARVTHVLRALGVAGAVVSDDGAGLREVDGLARLLGGGRWQPAGLGLVVGQLAAGEVTVVWVETVNDPRHVMLVWRDLDGRFWQIETQADGPQRVMLFDPTRPVQRYEYPSAAPIVLTQPLRVLTDADGRLRTIVPPGVVMATPQHPPTPVGRHPWRSADRDAVTVHALLDPPTTITPGMPPKHKINQDQATQGRKRRRGDRPPAGPADAATAARSGLRDGDPWPATVSPTGPDPMFTVPAEMFTVPTDGWCQLYAFIATDPILVRDVLSPSLSADPDLEEFLSDPGLVRSSITQMVAASQVPGTSELARVTQLLRAHVREYLARNAGQLPAEVTSQRVHFRQELEKQVRTLRHEQVLQRLTSLVGADVTRNGYLHPDMIQLRYDAVRSATPNPDPAALTDVPQRQLDFINQHNQGFPVTVLDQAQAREYLIAELTASDRPLDPDELAAVRDVVDNWRTQWAAPTGEFLSPLLAHATGSRITILRVTAQQVHPTHTYGPDTGRPVTLYHTAANPDDLDDPDIYNHYNAAVPAPTQQQSGPPPSNATSAPVPTHRPQGNKSRKAAPPLPPTPTEVEQWRPSPDGQGPSTLRAFLEQMRDGPGLRPGVSLPVDRNARLGPGMRAWVRSWALKLHGQENPATKSVYTTRQVADLSGGVHTSAVDRWWREAAPPLPPVPLQVSGWRPSPGGQGPSTLRAFLEQMRDGPGLRPGVSLTVDRNGRLGPGMRAWVRSWALGLSGQENPATKSVYTSDQVADLSGNLVVASAVRGWWQEAAPPLPPVEPEVEHWRPSPDGQGPSTLRAFLQQMELPSGVSLIVDRNGSLLPGMRAWVRSWALGLSGQENPATKSVYTWTAGGRRLPRRYRLWIRRSSIGDPARAGRGRPRCGLSCNRWNYRRGSR